MTNETRGVVVGGLLMFGAALLVAMGCGLSSFVDFLDKWQTFLAGALATGAALLTVSQIRAQIRQANEARQDEIRRQNDAARAVLPFTLSMISDYGEESMQALGAAIRERALGPPNTLTAVPGLPNLPAGILDAMRDNVEAADPALVDEIAALLQWLQIQHSRLRDLREGTLVSSRVPIITQHWLQDRAIDAAELLVRTDRLYPYARREPHHTRAIEGSEVESKLVRFDLYDLARGWDEMIASRYQKPIRLKMADPSPASSAGPPKVVAGAGSGTGRSQPPADA